MRRSVSPPGRVLALEWDSVDLIKGRLVVSRNLSRNEITTRKNGKTREIPLGDDVLATMKGHRHLRGDLVFCKPDASMLTNGECRHPLRAGAAAVFFHASAAGSYCITVSMRDE